MSVTTLEGIVENGQIRLITDAQLPERARVYIIVSDESVEQTAFIRSPRLAHSQQAVDFHMEIIQDTTDADV